MWGGINALKEFIDKTSEQGGTPINRDNLMAIQDYQNESVVFDANSITKTNSDNEVETITFGENQIIKHFVGKKTITQTIIFTENGYTKELS